MKIIINRCFGGFSYSEFFETEFKERYGKELDSITNYRTDPDIIKLFEELGTERASGKHAELKLVNIPDGIEYEISEYDGIERVREFSQSWY